MLRQLLIPILLVLVLVSTSHGQRRRRGGFFGGRTNSYSRLLRDEQLRKDLKLNKEQEGLLDALLGDLVNQVIAARRRPPSAESEAASPQRFVRQSDQLVSVVLKPHQIQRLSEIRLQVEGTRALQRSEVLEKLEVDEDQQSRIRALREELLQAQTDPPDRDAALLDVLTDDQRSALEAMKGEAYDGVERLRHPECRP